jgi:dynein heavy chain
LCIDDYLGKRRVSGCEVFQITLSRGYNETSFKEDLKKLYNLLGIDKKPTVFLFTAAQVADEGKSCLE